MSEFAPRDSRDFNANVHAARESAARQRERIAMRDELAEAIYDYASLCYGNMNEGPYLSEAEEIADRLMGVEGWVKGGGA